MLTVEVDGVPVKQAALCGQIKFGGCWDCTGFGKWKLWQLRMGLPMFECIA